MKRRKIPIKKTRNYVAKYMVLIVKPSDHKNKKRYTRKGKDNEIATYF